MTQINATMVRDLRERTGVGMMDCKKALMAANGDMDAAIEALRVAGEAKAVKKGDRVAAEGLISVAISPDQKTAVIAEVNCETDFVAREERFKDFCKNVANTALNKQSENIAGDLEADRLSLVAQIGENINIRRIKMLTAEDGGLIQAYMHGADGEFSRIGAVVAVSPADAEVARDVAMHVAAMKPEYLNEADIPSEVLAKEKEILLAQAEASDSKKPPEIMEKIISGRINKFIQEITLTGQPFVKDPDQTVGKMLQAKKVNVTSYIRFEVGQGIEKKADDFVNEVMSQVKG